MKIDAYDIAASGGRVASRGLPGEGGGAILTGSPTAPTTASAAPTSAQGSFTSSWGSSGKGVSAATTSLTTLASAGMVAAGADFGKLQFGLADLFAESGLKVMGLDAAARTAALESFQSSNTIAPVHAGYVAIDATALDGNGAALLAQLEALGFEGGVAYGALVGGYIPLDAIDDLAALANLNFARPAYSTSFAGSVQSQNVFSGNADVVQNNYGLDGTGVKIGFISDSFNTATLTTAGTPLTIHYAEDIASGDLPAGIEVLLDSTLSTNRDEGRAMMQLAHDIAPGATLSFHTAQGGQAIFAAGILALADAGAHIIVDDIIYFAEPMFQDGIIAQAVDTVTAGGVQYFSSAGNQAQRSYEATFVDSGQTYTSGGITYRLHDFDTGAGVDTTQTVTQSGNIIWDLQWAESFFSVGGAGAHSDLALIFRQLDGTLITVIDVANVGRDAIELGQINGTGSYTVSIGVDPVGTNPTFFKYVTFGGSWSANEYATNSSTSWGHSNAASAIGVAAADWYNTPAYGQSPPLGESFTSRGGTQIYLDTAGNLLATPETRTTVDITMADGGNNTFFGSDISSDADTLPNFYGTSAAAPNAAAIAALLLQASPNATAAQIQSALETTAIDITALATGRPTHNIGVLTGTGYDVDTGWGLIQADLALEALIGARATAIGETTQVRENATVSGNLFANDIVAAGGQTPALFKINGQAATFGSAITLASGALLTVNADGTYTYDPNHKFDYLIRNTLAIQLGAVNGFTPDTFTYTLVGGSTATVTVFVRGLEGPGDELRGDGTNNVINGTNAGNIFNLSQGGDDTVSGLAGSDTFYFGATLTAADRIDGGTETDFVILQGNYAAGLTLGTTSIVNVERINLLSGSDTSFGDTAGNSYSYKLTTVDANVASGKNLAIDAKDLKPGETLNFDGSAETNGTFSVRGGEGDDIMVGGRGNDQLGGRGGADIFGFFHGSGSDTITDFVSGTDRMDLSKLGFETHQQVMEATTDVGGNAVIALGGGDQVTVRGVTKAQLQSGDFIYAVPVPMVATGGGSGTFAPLAWDDDLFALAGTSSPVGGALYTADMADSHLFDGAHNQWTEWHVGVHHYDINLA
ncbi:S8 family serine peptidase [Sphingopyxis sp. KK2]|uniref:S8 family serine peptidase n=1 Tax=Sphingopyxis sp. KK2 TaxID=1855727 RepID=UPI00097E6332|nr:S8 family serine peptidase [Sphingopyxis sp. KK2]